jgi:hypothetical protein
MRRSTTLGTLAQRRIVSGEVIGFVLVEAFGPLPRYFRIAGHTPIREVVAFKISRVDVVTVADRSLR